MNIDEHKEALRVWLRGKGFHPADIKFALTWYVVKAKQGIDIQDGEVLAKADEAHKAAVNTINPPEILMRVEPKANIWSVLFGGAVATILLLQLEVIIWLVLVLTQ